MAYAAADTTNTGTVAGFFDSESKAKSAVDELMNAGFTRDQIGMALSSGTGSAAAYESGDRTNAAGYTNDTARSAEHEGEGFWNKLKDFFTGNEAEPYSGERQEGSLGTREITDDGSALDDYDAPNHDAVHHSLSGLSVAPDRASYFGGRFGRGDQGAVVTVSAGSRAAEAEAILQRNGADMGDAPQNFSAGADTNTANRLGDTAAQQDIKLYGEVLRVHKDRVSRGEVRLRKEVITDTQTIQVPVSREELVIERVPVSGEAVAAGADAFSNQEVRIPLSEERAHVEKQAVLQDEVRVGKREVGSTENFEEAVRREQLKVDDTTGTVRDTNLDTDRNS